MRILVATAGSWGDVLPLIPAVRALKGRKHEVTMAVPPIFVRSLKRVGVETARVAGVLKPDRINRFQGAVSSNRDGNALFESYWRDLLLPDAEATVRDLLPFAETADLIVSDRFNIAAYVASARLGIPRISVGWPGCVRSDDYSPPADVMNRVDIAGGFAPTARWANHIAWEGQLDWARDRLDGITNDLLDRLGADPLDASPFNLQLRADALLLTWHESLLPSPPDWPAGVTQVGYPYTDDVPELSIGDVDGFLNAGRPPVLVCFGTAIAVGAHELYLQVVERLLSRRERVLVLGPEIGLPRDGSWFAARYLPLSDVAHRCRAVVHHGGPGTVIGALRAGAPSLVIPQFMDQPQNAALVQHLGTGAGLRPWEVDERSLDEALDRVLADDTTSRAQALASVLKSEPDPGSRLADHIEALGSGHSHVDPH